jgi:hypothetical protein
MPAGPPRTPKGAATQAKKVRAKIFKYIPPKVEDNAESQKDHLDLDSKLI